MEKALDNANHYPAHCCSSLTSPCAMTNPFDRLTVLVVDDQELMRSVTVNQLKSMGWTRILTARNGAMGLSQTRSHQVDVILSDWNMPVMNGLAFLQAVRADAKLAKTPFLMITAETERKRIQDVIAAGVNALLVKPYNAATLRDRIERLLQPAATPAPKPASLAANPITGGALGSDGPEADSLPPLRILVVDDNPTSRLLLQKLFADDYYDVTVADGGPAALAACQNQLPDLVLMDVQMPGMDGFEVVQRLREDLTTANVPVMFVTADASDDNRTRGLELGAVDFVAKASPPKLLRQRVRNFLRVIEMRKQLQSEYDAMLETARLRQEVENLTRHDLKGALFGLVGMAESLAAEDDMPERHVGRLQLMADTAQHALHTVNLGGDIYKMETGRYQLNAQPVAVGALLHQLAALAREAFADKHLTISVDVDRPVGQELPLALGDETLCHSLFQNLLKNACEASPADGAVHVVLHDQSPLRISLHNKGVVPATIRDTFFDKFVTADKAGGSGLGTYSAKLMAESMLGSVSMATSDATQTTTLTVLLPRYIHPETPAGAAA